MSTSPTTYFHLDLPTVDFEADTMDEVLDMAGMDMDEVTECGGRMFAMTADHKATLVTV